MTILTSMSLHAGTVLSAGIAVALSAGSAVADPARLVKLTVREEAGTARMNEPVTVGVPFVEGAVKDAGRLILLDSAGKPVSAQFTPVTRWHTDKGGVQWAHLDFQASADAGGSTEFTVGLGDKPAAAVVNGVSVTEENNTVTVITGPLKFRVRGSRFNGFDGVWLDPSGKGAFSDDNMIVPPGNDGGGRVEGNGTVFLSTEDPDGKVEIESAGPMKAVVKAAGTHRHGADKRFDYVCRFYAYAGSPIVRVSYTFINRQGKGVGSMLELSALVLDVPTVLTRPAVVAGTETEPWSGQAAEDPVRALQKSSDAFAITVGDKEPVSGKGKSAKPLSTGWISIGSGRKGVACGIRWFWQMCPKGLSAHPDGRLSAGMLPKSAGATVDVYAGQSRTHDITFLFHSGKDARELNEFFKGSQKPLRPWAPASYYCRETHCFGYMAESDEKLFDPETWDIVRSFDDKMVAALALIRRKLDGHKYTYHTDSYGFYAWGDTFHWGWPGYAKSPKRTHDWLLSWAGNYYDYPNLCLLQCVRTGNMDFYRHAFEPNTVHIRDVFTCQWHPQRKDLYGACRYCPPRNHVATDDGRPYVSNEFNHNKSQCVFAHWYLTGDYRTREVIDLMMNNGLNNHDADSGWANRGIGAHLALLWQSWELTGEEKYRKRLIDMMNRACAQLEKTGGEFLKGPNPGIGYEGLVYAHWATADERCRNALVMVGERYAQKDRSRPTCSLALAYAWRLTGNEAIRGIAVKSVARAAKTNRPKDLAQANRNIPLATYYLMSGNLK